eukprot:TRINITY_DN8618_c0_g1_i1.p1 TRINITY_DN8618_c0_g1~~TRINITY_DN8618_c0_g1_i1.p1  ORF type:complete len:472 (-),score=78.46 TRINITY_DN8618_c0_g1_i1:16-1431(-)
MNKTKPVLLVIVLLALCLVSHAKTKNQWKGRTIYQLLTDRFAKPGPDSGSCNDLSKYCGGNYQGAIEKLDYIKNLGFDAVWITPIVNNTPGGYHGYWLQDLFGFNPNFGSEKDFVDFVRECHKRDIWVMVDVVANHVGPVGYNYETISPFNDSSHYHKCDICPSSCQIEDWNNQNQVEMCRLANLPDLNQDNSFVHDEFMLWISQLVSKYNLDGIRIDTVPEVKKTFWQDFRKSADCFQIGEVFNGEIKYVASYQECLDSVLSYPLYFTLKDVFAHKQSMYNIQSVLQAYSSSFKDTSVLGTFIDNHDNARFLSMNGDYQLYKSALTYVLLSEGIPIVYYGTEQGYAGGNDPKNRESLWPNYNEKHELFQFIQKVLSFRKSKISTFSSAKQIQRYADDNFYAFSRGDIFVAVTNSGSNSGGVSRTITYNPYENGTKICNIFYEDTDCLVVNNGTFSIYLLNGESKIYYPVQ